MRRFYTLLSVALAAYCLVVASPSNTQAQQSETVRQLEKRVDAMAAQNLAERMARMEALMETAKNQGETTNKLLMGVFATLALMLAERAIRGGPARAKRRQMMFGESEE